jgi:hypothetical protein
MSFSTLMMLSDSAAYILILVALLIGAGIGVGVGIAKTNGSAQKRVEDAEARGIAKGIEQRKRDAEAAIGSA